MDGMTMREPEDARRLEDLPEHEDDADVAGTMGAGVLGQGGTAVDRGTGELGGVAQGTDAGEEDAEGVTNDPQVGARMADLPLASAGLVDYTHADEDDAGDGPAGERPLDMSRDPSDLDR